MASKHSLIYNASSTNVRWGVLTIAIVWWQKVMNFLISFAPPGFPRAKSQWLSLPFQVQLCRPDSSYRGGRRPRVSAVAVFQWLANYLSQSPKNTFWRSIVEEDRNRFIRSLNWRYLGSILECLFVYSMPNKGSFSWVNWVGGKHCTCHDQKHSETKLNNSQLLLFTLSSCVGAFTIRSEGAAASVANSQTPRIPFGDSDETSGGRLSFGGRSFSKSFSLVGTFVSVLSWKCSQTSHIGPPDASASLRAPAATAAPASVASSNAESESLGA